MAINNLRQAANDADPFDQSEQRKATRAYIKAAFEAIGAVLQDQNSFPTNSAYRNINVGDFYKTHVANMEQYRWGLSNLALS